MNRLFILSLLCLSLSSFASAQSVPSSCVGEIRPDGSLGPCNGGGGGGSHGGGKGWNRNADGPAYTPYGQGDPRCLPGSFENGRGCILNYGGYGPEDIRAHYALMDRIDAEGWTQRAANDYMAAAKKYGWPVAYYNYALVEESLGNYDEAWRYFDSVAKCEWHAGPGGYYAGEVCDQAREQRGHVEEHYGLEALKRRDFTSAEAHFRKMLADFTDGDRSPGCQHHTDIELDKSPIYDPNNQRWIEEIARRREGHCDMTAAYIDLAIALEGQERWDDAHGVANLAVEHGASTRGTKYCGTSNSNFEKSCHDDSNWLQAATDLVHTTWQGGEYAKATRLLQTAKPTGGTAGADWDATMATALTHLENAVYWDANDLPNKLGQRYRPRGHYIMYDGTELPGQYHSYSARALIASVLHVQGKDNLAERQAGIALLQHPGDPTAQLTLDTVHKHDLEVARAHGSDAEHWPNAVDHILIEDMDSIQEKCTLTYHESGGLSVPDLKCPHHDTHFLTTSDREFYVGTSPFAHRGSGCHVVPSLAGEEDCDEGWTPQRDGSFWRMKFEISKETRCEVARNGQLSEVDCSSAPITTVAAQVADSQVPQVVGEGSTGWLKQDDGSYWRIYLGQDNKWHCQTAKSGGTGTEIACK